MKYFKVLMLCLGVLMMAQLFKLQAGAYGLGSDELVYYNRVTPAYPAMNRDTYNSSAFWSAHVGSDNNSVYNITPAFSKDSSSKGASSMPDHLNFGTSFKHKSDDNTYWVYYKYYFEDSIKAAARKGDLSIAFMANLTNDKHWNVERHLDNYTAYPTTYIEASNKKLIKHDTGSMHYDTTQTLGRNVFVPVGTYPWNDELRFVAYGNTCTCGSSKVSNISILLADLTGPKVKSIFTTRLSSDGITMEPYTRFKGNDTLFINLKFDENIRFAGDAAMALADAPKLKFKVKRITDNVQEPAISAEASLVSLDKDTLTFVYKVPETFDVAGKAVNANHYIYEVEPYASQSSWVNSSKTYDLKLLGKNGALINSAQKASSMIVDLAGNPIELNSKVTLEAPAYMDNVAPAVKKVEIVRATASDPSQMSRSDVFARVGEKLGFFVYFSEEMYFVRKSDNACLEPDFYIYYNESHKNVGIYMREPFLDGGVPITVMADLNIGIDGTPVTATAQYMITVQDGVNGPVMSKVYFEMDNSTPISAAMAPLIFNEKQLPIGVDRIYMVLNKEVYALSDSRGNVYDEGLRLVNASDEARVMPAQQLWLDVVDPSASTSLTSSMIGYIPFGYEDSSDPSEFCFPVTVYDQASHGEEYRSLTNGVTGSFMWRDNTGSSTDYAFLCAVTGSADKPADTDFKPAVTGEKISFTQLDSGNYIHIRLLEDVSYNIGDSHIVIYPVDNAGNEGEAALALDYEMDRAGPVSVRDKYKQQYDSLTSSGRIDADISLWDFNEITGIEYQWTTTGGTPTEGGWTSVTSYSSLEDGPYNRVKLVLSKTGLAADINHRLTLHVRGRDSLNQANTGSFDFVYDLTLPKFNTEFITNPAEPLAVHSLKIHIPQPYSSNPKVANYVMVMVKKKLSNGTYDSRALFRCSRNSLFSSNTILKGPANAWDLLAVGSDPSAEGWYACTPERQNNPPSWGYYAGSGTEYSYGSLWPEEATLLKNMFNSTYGEVEITVFSRNINGNAAEYYIKDSELYSKETYIYRFANASAIGANEIIHTAAITPKSKVSYGTYSGQPVVPYSSVPSVPAAPRSLDGAIFNVALSNSRAPSFGILDIDFNSPDTYFALYKTGEGASETPLFTSPLIPKASQDIAIPAGIATAHGTYKAVVSVKCKNSDHIDKREYTAIMVDRRETNSYGVTQVRTLRTLDNGAATLPETVVDYDLSQGSRVSEILVSADQNVAQSILFESDLPSLTFGAETDYASYIKVWNETNGVWIPLERYKWIPLAGKRAYKTALLSLSTQTVISNKLSSALPEDAALIPIIPGENIIKYQIATTSGYTTPVQTLILKAGDLVPSIEMTLSPEKTAGKTVNGDVVASIHALGSSLVSPETLEIGLVFPDGVTHEGDLITNFRLNQQVTLTENGVYYFYAMDKYHNYGYQKVTVDYIDREGPTLTVNNRSSLDKNTYDFDLTIQDTFNLEGCRLYMGFDDAYSSVLGAGAGSFFEVPLAGSWKADSPNNSGLFNVSASSSGASRSVSLSGAFKYDSSGSASAIRMITFYAEDGSGNKSANHTFSITVRNEPTAFISGSLADGSFAATFNKPVILKLPYESTLSPVYEMAKKNLPFYSNGVYSIKCTDLFGEPLEGNITVNQYDALYNCTVGISETAPTNKDVEVLINAAFNPKITLDFPGSIDGASINREYNSKGELVGVSVTMTKNGTLTYSLKPVDKSFPQQTRTITVGNIDKIPPVVDLTWVYTSEVSNGFTKGDIIASLLSNEELESIEGTSTTHIFTLSDQGPYTFHYSDKAGNKGSITAAPVVEIIEKTSVLDDLSPPDYELSIYQNRDGLASIKVAGYNRTEYELIADKAGVFPLFSGALRLQFDIQDENQTTLGIKNEPVAGVSVRGTTVTVSENASFIVVITDANGNKTEVPVVIDKADNTAPTGTITYVKTGAYSVRGYITLSDDQPGEIRLKNTTGVLLETAPGPYQGQYYHDFLDNESFAFVFADKANNSGSVIAAVTSLDMDEPSGTIIQWDPYFIDAAGNEHKGQLSDTMTNTDVSVYLGFSKPIRTLSPSIMDGKGSIGDIAVKQSVDNATVVFRQNAKVMLAFTALNGKNGSMVLEVDIIDKTEPVIKTVLNSGTPNSATYTFTSNEPVIFEDGEGVSSLGTSFTRKFELNGGYRLKFTDSAGNSKTVLLTVAGIDRLAPGISVIGLPASKAAVEAYNQANGTSIEHKMTNSTVTISAFLSETGTILFNGRSYPVNAGEQIPLNISYNGIYEITATDLAGMVTRYQFVIDCIDKSKPQILLSGGSIVVRQGTALSDFEAKALSQVIVTDNVDLNPMVTLTASLSESQLNTPGTYSITFTAFDKAGNIQTANCFVRVYDKNALEVLVNGVFAKPGDTLFVGGTWEISVTVGNLPSGSGGSEPYKMYWRSGLNTAGQMKNATLFSGSFTAPKNGFYTLYLVTQSKASFMTYVYVQQ